MRRVTKMVALASMAVPAAAGCVSVGAPPDGHAGSAGPTARASGTPGLERPQFVRPSAREAVSDPDPTRSSPAAAQQSGPSAGHERKQAGGAAPGPAGRAPERAAPRRHTGAPAPVTTAPELHGLPSGTGVCDLGRRYGHWKEGGQAARICEDAYGR